MYFIRDGAVKLTLALAGEDDLAVGFAMPGDAFGELAALDGSPRTATATASEPTVADYLPREAFLSALERSPQLALRLMRLLANRLRQADRAHGELAFGGVFGRVARSAAVPVARHSRGSAARPAHACRTGPRVAGTGAGRAPLARGRGRHSPARGDAGGAGTGRAAALLAVINVDGPRLVLASASPRRRLLLGLLGIPFRTAPSDIPVGAAPGRTCVDLAVRLAVEKALACAAPAGSVVLAADTVVVLAGRLFGKPVDAVAADAMLRALRAREHVVATGVAVRPAGGAVLRGCIASRVTMRDYSAAEVAASAASGVPLDKAGGYAIQDDVFRPVAALAGCFLTVVGLPLCEVVRQLRAAGRMDAAPAGPFEPPCVFCSPGRSWRASAGGAAARVACGQGWAPEDGAAQVEIGEPLPRYRGQGCAPGPGGVPLAFAGRAVSAALAAAAVPRRNGWRGPERACPFRVPTWHGPAQAIATCFLRHGSRAARAWEPRHGQAAAPLRLTRRAARTHPRSADTEIGQSDTCATRTVRRGRRFVGTAAVRVAVTTKHVWACTACQHTRGPICRRAHEWCTAVSVR